MKTILLSGLVLAAVASTARAEDRVCSSAAVRATLDMTVNKMNGLPPDDQKTDAYMRACKPGSVMTFGSAGSFLVGRYCDMSKTVFTDPSNGAITCVFKRGG